MGMESKCWVVNLGRLEEISATVCAIPLLWNKLGSGSSPDRSGHERNGDGWMVYDNGQREEECGIDQMRKNCWEFILMKIKIMIVFGLCFWSTRSFEWNPCLIWKLILLGRGWSHETIGSVNLIQMLVWYRIQSAQRIKIMVCSVIHRLSSPNCSEADYPTPFFQKGQHMELENKRVYFFISRIQSFACYLISFRAITTRVNWHSIALTIYSRRFARYLVSPGRQLE
jgi:hypothetical protein